MPATVPVISADDNTTAEKIEGTLDTKLKMNGILLDDVKVIRGMDKSELGKYIPVKIKLDTPMSDRSLANIAQFGEIFKKKYF